MEQQDLMDMRGYQSDDNDDKIDIKTKSFWFDCCLYWCSNGCVGEHGSSSSRSSSSSSSSGVGSSDCDDGIDNEANTDGCIHYNNRVVRDDVDIWRQVLYRSILR
jgi:hypothetical protein